jgi:hypothetical protein
VGPIFLVAHALFTQQGQFFAARYLIFLPIGAALCLAIGSDALLRSLPWRRIRTAGASALAILVLGLYLPPAMDITKYISTRMRVGDWRSTGLHLEKVSREGDVIVVIDTKPFAPGSQAAFEAAPRYYTGPATHGRPQDFLRAPHTAQALAADRYHFVLAYVRSDLVNEIDLPPDWELKKGFRMWTITTSSLATHEERAEAWWFMGVFLADPASIYTELAGYAVARDAGVAEARPWAPTIISEASQMGALPAVQALLDQVERPSR